MKTVSEIIANELKKIKIDSIFMLTGYGAMYLNDAIEKAKIKYYAARNEAAAPMMAPDVVNPEEPVDAPEAPAE